MTFSRAQMIEAFELGVLFRGQKGFRHGAAFTEAQRYVDSLQGARETDEKPRENSDILGNEPGYGQSIGSLHQTLREHILKYQERELVLAKLVGGFLFRLAHFPPNARPQFLTIDWIESGIQSLNTVFPELTQEE